MKINQDSRINIAKLTALWGVSESGLGGFLHALKIPFSGLLLGSFAVIIVTFIALHSTKKFKTILQATLLVILIKAIASPHSPFTAYVAVLFQGFIGALFYQIFGVNKFSAVLFGVIALLESALQKLLMMVLVFGNNIWVAFQEFFVGIAKQLHLKSLEEIPFLLVSLYVFIYFIMGIFAGLIALRIPLILHSEYKNIDVENLPDPKEFTLSKKQKNKTGIFTFCLILLFIVSVFLFSGSLNKALYSILRTFAALGFLYFVAAPIFHYFLNKWKVKQKSNANESFREVLEFLPQYRNHAKIAFKLAETENSNYRKLRQFVLIWMSLSLYHEDEINQ